MNNRNEGVMGYIKAVRDNFVEPPKHFKGDRRVLVNGEPPHSECRVLCEEYYQLFFYLLRIYCEDSLKEQQEEI
jgi:hypothetical protein